MRIKCPTGHTLIVPDDRAGRTLKCPRCDQPVVVPGGEADAAGSALLSVLAEGIPAVTLAVGTLRVAESGAPNPPPNPPRPKFASAPTPTVKPKSRVIPAPSTPRPDPVQPPPEPVELKSELPKLESSQPEPQQPEPPPALLAGVSADSIAKQLASVAEPAAKDEPAPIAPLAAVEPPCPIVETIAERLLPPEAAAAERAELAEPDDAPPIAAEQPAPPPFVWPVQSPATVNLNADAARTLAVYQLAVALAGAALFSVVPAVWDVVEYMQFAESPFVARWALGLFFLGVVQLAYAVYLFQLPDWTTVWVVTLFSLALAAVYAAALGLVLLTPADGFLVGPHGLQVADKLAGGKAALWCLCMVSLSTIVAFFAGRQSTSWYKAEMMLRATAL